MSFGYYGILIIFGLFFLLLIFNPNLSCFGKRIKSPFYPLFRKKKKKKIKTQDYGFSLVDDRTKQKAETKKQGMKTESYRSSTIDYSQQEVRLKKKKVKTQDYGFSLVDDDLKQKPEGEKEKK